MKHRIVTICLLILAMLGIAAGAAMAGNDIADHRSCNYCGMDRKAYGYSRMLINYKDGTKVGVCSLHCAVIELDASKGREVSSLLVADRNSHTLIDAEKAVWVMGGKKRGVMTQRPKWAFSTMAAAKAFVEANGGTITPWADVLAAARADAAPQPRR